MKNGTKKAKEAPNAKAEADDRRREFCNLLDVIERRPDAEQRLDQVRAMLKTIAGSADDLNEEVDEDAAAERLAGAIATIEECRDFIPDAIYTGLVDALGDWLTSAQWSHDPALVRKCAPHIFRKIFAAEDEEDGE